MGNADAQNTTEIETNSQDWINFIKTSLGAVDHDHVQSCSICVVPGPLRKSNENAYMPKVVTMGPLYKGTSRDLLHMEVIKLRCLLSLLKRTEDGEEKLDECSKAIMEAEGVVRASYVDEIKLDSTDLAKTMLYDGCFLLEVLICGSKELNGELGGCLGEPGAGPQVVKEEEVLSDLILLENQIPLFILHTLSQTLFPDVFPPHIETVATKINSLALSLFGYPQVSNPHAPHILELVHSSIPPFGQQVNQIIVHEPNMIMKNENGDESVVDIQDQSLVIKNDDDILVRRKPISTVEEKAPVKSHVKLKLNRCATRLQAAGVTIRPPDRRELSGRKEGVFLGLNLIVQSFLRFPGNFLNYAVEFGKMLLNVLVYIWCKLLGRHVETKKVNVPRAVEVRGFDFDIEFSNRRLVIPQLHITKTTKAKWCSFIAWEHHKKNWMSSSIASSSRGKGASKCTSAALIFNGLICCAADVQLLKDRNVVVDHLKMSNEELMAFFRTISEGVEHGIVDSGYIETIEDLNTHPAACWFKEILVTMWHIGLCHLIRFYKFLWRKYNFVASFLAVISLGQLVYAALTYHQHK